MHFLVLLLQLVMLALLLLIRPVGCTALQAPCPGFCVSGCSSLSPSSLHGASLRHFLPADATRNCLGVCKGHSACRETNVRGPQAPPGVRTPARTLPSQYAAAAAAASAAAAAAGPGGERRPSQSGVEGPACAKDGAACAALPVSPASGLEQQPQEGKKGPPPRPPAARSRGVRGPPPVHTGGVPSGGPLPTPPRDAPPREPLPAHPREAPQKEALSLHSSKAAGQLPLVRFSACSPKTHCRETSGLSQQESVPVVLRSSAY